MSAYAKTKASCYLAYFIQGIVMNLTAVLFVPLQMMYGFSYSQLGVLVFINFVFQLLADTIFGEPVDRYGFRPFSRLAPVICAVGLVMFATVPYWADGFMFVGFCIATAVFSLAIGLLEVILSPIVGGLPGEHTASSMAVLHSFLAWGIIAAIAGTTLLLSAFGTESWQWIVLAWAVLPLINCLLFWGAWMPASLPGQQRMKTGELIKNRIFLLSFAAIFFGAAAELALMQWISAFLERGAGMSKVAGDLLGLCGFALCFGVGRLVYSRFGKNWDIHKVLILGSVVTVLCYIVVALSPWTWLTVAACWIAGAATCLLWPETLVIASAALPAAGAALFGLLAAGGDFGAAISNYLVGTAADMFIGMALDQLSITPEQFGLRAAVLVACVLPVLSAVFQLLLRQKIEE